MTALFLRMIALIGFVSLMPSAGPLAQQVGEVVKVSRFSGKPVPRFESLRYSAVHGRQGPNLDHPILWRYEREGLPMLIVRETHGWRRVRDPDGDEVWMQSRMLSGARTALVTEDVELLRKPDMDATARAKVKSGVIAELEICTEGWCEVKIDRKSGWIPQDVLWGTELGTGKL